MRWWKRNLLLILKVESLTWRCRGFCIRCWTQGWTSGPVASMTTRARMLVKGVPAKYWKYNFHPKVPKKWSKSVIPQPPAGDLVGEIPANIAFKLGSLNPFWTKKKSPFFHNHPFHWTIPWWFLGIPTGPFLGELATNYIASWRNILSHPRGSPPGRITVRKITGITEVANLRLRAQLQRVHSSEQRSKNRWATIAVPMGRDAENQWCLGFC